MIYGNDNSKKILSKYFDNIKKNGIDFNFLLLEGDYGLGKTSIVKEYIYDLLGENYKTDFLFIKDLSELIGKKHNLKVDVDDNDRYLYFENYGTFVNYGARQIIEWVNKSSLGKYKVVLLENIERMTISAANSFLKTFEEGVKDTIIIGTTSNRLELFDTILSRSFLIKFDTPSYKNIKDYLKEFFPNVDDSKIDFAIFFSCGKVAFATNFLSTGYYHDYDFNDLHYYFNNFIIFIEQGSSYNDKLSLLNNINKFGLNDVFINSLIYYFSFNKRYDIVDILFQKKTLIDSNLSIENVFFDMILDIEKSYS